MKKTLIGVVVLSAAFAARPSRAASIEDYIPREEARRVAALMTRQLLSTEVDAYRPKGFAKELPEIVCYPEGRPGQFIHYSVVTLWANALMCARWAGEKEMEEALAAVCGAENVRVELVHGMMHAGDGLYTEARLARVEAFVREALG